jgi:signal transduction histidine kinase/CheY-like chemotaxis protein
MNALHGGGEAGNIVRSIDWAGTPLGPVETWSQSLKATVGIVLHSRHPMFLWWGPELIQFYNDAYTPSFGQGRHPAAMGQRGRDCWGDVWPIIWPQIDDVMARAKASWNEDELVPILRNGRLEEVYWTYGYSPVFDDDGSVGGTLVVCTETTPRVLAARRLRVLGDLTESITLAVDAARVDRIAVQALGRATFDVPFAFICTGGGPGEAITVSEAAGLSEPQASELAALLGELALSEPQSEAGNSPIAVPGPPIVVGEWPVPVAQLFIETLRDSSGKARAKLVVGLSPRLNFDADYRVFLRQVAERIGFGLGRVETFRARALAENERNNLLLQAPIATSIVTGPEHVFRLTNDSYLRMVGRRDLVGKSFVEAFPEVAGTDLPKILDEVYRTGKPFTAEEYLVPLARSDGSGSDDTFFKFSLDPLRDGSGNVYGMIAMAIDTTEQVRARRMLEKTHQEREVLLTELEAANSAKDEFLAMLGHELRNPLSPITTALELMKLHSGGQASREEQIITRQVKHLTRLVDDLLDVSKITRGKVELKRELVEVADVLARAVEIASFLFEQRGHRLLIDAPRSGLRLKGDPVRLAQVVANLLTNAARYTNVGGTVTLGARREAEQVVISVADDGTGISPEMLPQIFEPFVQGKRTRERAEGGLGLGLALVKNLVHLHGGEVHAESEGLGKGSVFTIRLPARPAPSAADAEADLMPATPEPGPNGSGRNVLVVDDNADAADLLEIMLQAAGHHVTVAHDPLAALELLGRAEGPKLELDVVVLDIGLPVMDGYELGARLRARSPTCRLIALTGYGQGEDRERSAAAGFDVHLVKPVEMTALLAAIRG